MATTSDQIFSKLFNFKTSFAARGITFYMRVVNDSVVDDARSGALLESRKMRRSLRDPNTTEYLIHLDVINDFTDEELKNLITVNASRDVMREYIQNTPRPQLDPLPTNPTQEQQEEHEAAKNEREEVYWNNLDEHLKQWRDTFMAGLDARDRKYWEFMARRYQTDMICEQVFTEYFEDYVAWNSLYTDDKYKTKVFDSLDAYKQLPADLRAELRAKYNDLTVGADDVKN